MYSCIDLKIMLKKSQCCDVSHKNIDVIVKTIDDCCLLIVRFSCLVIFHITIVCHTQISDEANKMQTNKQALMIVNCKGEE